MHVVIMLSLLMRMLSKGDCVISRQMHAAFSPTFFIYLRAAQWGCVIASDASNFWLMVRLTSNLPGVKSCEASVSITPHVHEQLHACTCVSCLELCST